MSEIFLKGGYVATSSDLPGLFAGQDNVEDRGNSARCCKETHRVLWRTWRPFSSGHQETIERDWHRYCCRHCLMGPLAGFKYNEVVRKLRNAGFVFDRNAKRSHEIFAVQHNFVTSWKKQNGTDLVFVVPHLLHPSPQSRKAVKLERCNKSGELSDLQWPGFFRQLLRPRRFLLAPSPSFRHAPPEQPDHVNVAGLHYCNVGRE